MIAEKGDESVFIKAELPQTLDHPPHLEIVEGDFPVVRSGRVSCAERLRRAIRAVRVIQVEPGEKRLRFPFLQPVEETVHSAVPAPFEQGKILRLWGVKVHAVVIHFEAPIQSPHRIKDKRAYEG